jgi:hypothetical protein
MSRRPSQPTLAQLLDGESPTRDSFPDEEPTQPQHVGFELELLEKFYLESAPEDRAYILRLAEGYAARNRKT